MLITLVETPRDAFQGLTRVIPTSAKLLYCETLLDAGFGHIDLGSFVSPHAVPQMTDSAILFEALANRAWVERIAIVANLAGAQKACATAGVDTLGFPFSLSERFQVANTRVSRRETWPDLLAILRLARTGGKGFILYASMAFGNLDGEEWSATALEQFVAQLAGVGVKRIALSDTVAVAQPEQVRAIFRELKSAFPALEFSAHFHSRISGAGAELACVEAALDAGCTRFDCAAGGLGGCPFAHDELIANTPSEVLVRRLDELGLNTGIDLAKLELCAARARDIQREFA